MGNPPASAADYARQGWKLVPLHSPRPDGSCDCRGRHDAGSIGKHPRLTAWVAEASADSETVAAWWRQWPMANIGAIAGEAFDAFDIEAAHVDRFTSYQGDRQLPETAIARSGSGGLHIFVAPSGRRHTSKLFIDGTHIGEYKASGQVVLAPSVSGRGQYSWLWWPTNDQLADAPDWLDELIERALPSEHAVRWQQVSLAPESALRPLADYLRRATKGDRNGRLWWAVRRADAEGIPGPMADAELLEAFLSTPSAGEDAAARRREAVRTIASAHSNPLFALT
jgi:hypothetical protein